jgi:hypothetical protein
VAALNEPQKLPRYMDNAGTEVRVAAAVESIQEVQMTIATVGEQ